MTSFNYDIGEKDRVGSRFISMVHHEVLKAFAAEKTARKVTQQELATKVGVNRSVINRQLRGLENMTAKSIAELLWAMGWEPEFKAVKIQDDGANDIPPTQQIPSIASQSNSAPIVAKVTLDTRA